MSCLYRSLENRTFCHFSKKPLAGVVGQKNYSVGAVCNHICAFAYCMSSCVYIHVFCMFVAEAELHLPCRLTALRSEGSVGAGSGG